MVELSLQFHSHCVDRRQRIVLDKFSLHTTRLSRGVPQGTGLGQGLLFSIHFSFRRCNYGSRLKFNDVYADNSQIYIVMRPRNRVQL